MYKLMMKHDYTWSMNTVVPKIKEYEKNDDKYTIRKHVFCIDCFFSFASDFGPTKF